MCALIAILVMIVLFALGIVVFAAAIKFCDRIFGD